LNFQEEGQEEVIMANSKIPKKEEDTQLDTWCKKIEMIGIDNKSLDRENDTRRLKLRTTSMNQHFINELDKNGLQLIEILQEAYLVMDL
jgi:hypothetical protein